MTLYQTLSKWADEQPDRPAYRYFGDCRSYGSLRNSVDITSGKLVTLGVRAGDRVGLCLVNSPQMLHLLYALNRIGAVAVMISPKASKRELREQLTLTECRLLFCTELSAAAANSLDNVTVITVPLFAGLPIRFKFGCAGRIVKHGRLRGAVSLGSISVSENIPPVSANDDADAAVIFSSGTSGECKAVVHTNKSMIASAIYCMQSEQPLPGDADMYAILPCYHAYGLIVSVNTPIMVGCCCRLMPFFHISTIVSHLRQKMPTFIPAVPTVFKRLVDNKRFCRLIDSGRLDTSRFRTGFVGGDVLPEGVKQAFDRLMRVGGGTGVLCPGYGMSECCPITVERDVFFDGSVGLPFDNNEVMVCGEGDDTPLPDGASGEICVHSAGMMSRAFTADKTFTPTVFADGKMWLRTGDIGHMNNGRLYFERRMRRLIKVSGHTVFADAVEKVVGECDRVGKVIAVPVPHATRGSGVYLYFTGDADSRDVLDYCRRELMPYAVPVGISHIDQSDIPLTELGKIAYGVLEKAAAQNAE